MAITQAYQARLFRSAIGMIVQGVNQGATGTRVHAIPAEGNLARRLQSEYSFVPGINFASAQSVARRAISAYRAAETMQLDTSLAYRASQLPIDPYLRAGDERYHYLVYVHRTDAQGHAVSYTTDIVSDTPMSSSDIDQYVREHLDSTTSARRSTRQAIGELGPGQSVYTSVLSAGKRGP